MNTLQPEQLVAQLNWRYATKQFDPQRKISPREWASLEEALVLSPSSCGLQPWKFFVVNDTAIREKLVPVSWGQRQVVDASHLVVFTIKKNLSEADVDTFLKRVCEVRGVSLESLAGYRNMIMGAIINGRSDEARNAWAANQAYIALGNFLTSAAVLGIDACPMEGIEPGKYDEILGLDKKGLATVFVATAGYRAATDKNASMKKVRFPHDDVIVRI